MEKNDHTDYQQHHQLQHPLPAGPVSVGDWFVTLLLMAIPLVNLIMLFVWAFSDGTNKSKSNWAKASLIWMLVGIVLMIVFWSAFAAIFAGMGGMYGF